MMAAGSQQCWPVLHTLTLLPKLNIPLRKSVPVVFQMLADEAKAPRLSQLLSGAKKGEIEQCTRKCLPTCMRGGSYGGAPGLGPISLRREPVVFKEEFRSRSYCLSECATVCSLQIRGPAAETAGK